MMPTTTQGDKFLVRLYNSNKDKENVWVDTLEEALRVLKVNESDIVSVSEWLGFVDYSIRGTKNYIRKVKKVLVD